MDIKEYKVSRIKPEITINNKVLGKDFIVIAGPCTVYQKDSLFETVEDLKKLGVTAIRGGTFKPRTSPYSYQGLGEEGINLLLQARQEYGLPIVTEITSIEYLNKYGKDIDIIQIGSKNMFNYELLKAVGRQAKPVILKRNMSATYEEWLNAAEYIINEGNEKVILCERGIRTFETETRNTLDLQAIPYIKMHTSLPIIIDPSHASGNKDFVEAMAKAAIAAGADGLLIETSKTPEEEICDSKQTIDTETLKRIIEFCDKFDL